MNLYILCLLGVLLISIICGLIFIPAILRFCKKKNLYDAPGIRKIHKISIPRLGGVCFMPSMFIAVLIVLSIHNHEAENNQISFSLWSICFFISMSLIYVVGIIDDLVGLNAKTKFIVQILAASLMPLSGLYINNLYGLWGIYDIPLWLGAPLTVFVIVFINNAINLIDGIDGLSAGLSLLSLCGFLYCFMNEGLFLYSILITGLIGVLLTFLYFNLFGKVEKGTKIFMGDSGSLTLGFILGFLLVKFSMDNPNIMPFRSDSLMISCTLLMVPVFDVFRVIFVRIRHKQPIFNADKNHIHHKLMRAGLNQHQALIVILLFSMLFMTVNILLSMVLDFSYIIIIDVVIWLLFHYVLNGIIRKNGQKAFQIEKTNER